MLLFGAIKTQCSLQCRPIVRTGGREERPGVGLLFLASAEARSRSDKPWNQHPLSYGIINRSKIRTSINIDNNGNCPWDRLSFSSFSVNLFTVFFPARHALTLSEHTVRRTRRFKSAVTRDRWWSAVLVKVATTSCWQLCQHDVVANLSTVDRTIAVFWQRARTEWSICGLCVAACLSAVLIDPCQPLSSQASLLTCCCTHVGHASRVGRIPD